MTDLAANLADLCQQLPYEVKPEQQQKLLDYLAALQKWNKAFNLTAVRDPQEMLTHHLMDCLAIAPYFAEGSLLDVGTGAGFPGIVLAIIYPEKAITLVDCNSKKVRFLRQVVHELGLTCVQPVHGRVEAVDPKEKFQIITSRAFASLQDMVKLTAHLLADEGKYLAMKGVQPDQEMQSIDEQFLVEQVIPLSVPGLPAQRHLIDIRRGARG